MRSSTASSPRVATSSRSRTEGATGGARSSARSVAMRGGREVIHQGCFVRDGWVGYPDFLIRVDEPSDLGAWSYEVYDAKLGSQPQPGHIFQLLFYTDELTRIQGRRPERMHLMLGDGERPRVRARGLRPPTRERVRSEFERALRAARGRRSGSRLPVQGRASATSATGGSVCARPAPRATTTSRSSPTCTAGRASSSRPQGVHTVGELAGLAGGCDAFRACARATLGDAARAGVDCRSAAAPLDAPALRAARARGRPRPRPPARAVGRATSSSTSRATRTGARTASSTCSAPCTRRTASGATWPLWATTRAEEQRGVRAWVDWITARLAAHPDLHVFHFNAYEPTALKRLCRAHAHARARARRAAAPQGASSTSTASSGRRCASASRATALKAMEPSIGFERDAELRGAIGSMRALAGVAGGRRPGAPRRDRRLQRGRLPLDARAARLAARSPRPRPRRSTASRSTRCSPSRQAAERAELAAYLERLEAMRPRLLDGPARRRVRGRRAQRARRMTFDLLGYHRREAKPAWWAYLRPAGQTPRELRDEDTRGARRTSTP